MKFWNHFIDMTAYNDAEITQFLENNNYSDITVYLRDKKSKQEIIKEIGGKTHRINDDYNQLSLSDRFMEWMTVVAQK